MSQNRSDLLDGLHEARTRAGNTEQCLKQILVCASLPDEQLLRMESILDQTHEQQWLLGQCVRRINDVADSSDDAESDLPVTVSRSSGADQHGATALCDLHRAVGEEIDIYADLIEAAEGAGLFETKWVCERILSKKTVVVDWLAVAGRFEASSRPR
jgi:ferritin-like metal-binding protein YciE